MPKQQTVERRIRRRATALVIRDGKVLLVRDPNESTFVFPGGGVDRGESCASAVVRELHEETGLVASRVEYLFDYCDFWGDNGIDYWGQVQSVFRVAASGEVTPADDVCEFRWWDRRSNLPLWDCVEPVLDMAVRSE